MSGQPDETRIARVLYVEPGHGDKTILKRLSLCGKMNIRSVYYLDSKSGVASFFVEFDDTACAERARRCETPDTKLYLLKDRRDLVDRFTSLARHSTVLGGVEQDLNDSHIPTLSSEGRPIKRYHSVTRTHSGRKRRRDERSNQHKGAQGKNKHADSPYPESSHARSPRKKRSLPAYMRDTEKENGRSSVGASLPSSSSTPTPGLLAFGEPDSLENLSNPFIVLDPFLMDPTNGALNLDSSAFIPETMPCFQQFPSFPFSVPQPDPTPFTLPSLSFPSFTSLPTPSPSTPAAMLSTTNLISHDGSGLIYDLDSLPEDPQGVIDILKQSAASLVDRDKWMIVAGHYRSRSNTEAALAVGIAMIEVMTSPSVGLSENDLKPVYLMLSSCHTDLAKRAQSSGLASQIREDHRCKAQEYLQKVYGKNTPGDPPVSLAAPQPGRLFNASNLNPTPVASVSENTASPPAGGSETSTRGPTALEREVRSLRDRHQNLNKQYSDAKTAKRKAEDDLGKEHRLRRKAEREIITLKEEIESSRRSERFALEQSRREVELRRRAEQVAEELQSELAKAREQLEVADKGTAEKEQRAKECFARVGKMFLKASKGDMGVLESVGRPRSSSVEGFKREQHSVEV